jgi:isoleucyl-tRNA synthetase
MSHNHLVAPFIYKYLNLRYGILNGQDGRAFLVASTLLDSLKEKVPCLSQSTRVDNGELDTKMLKEVAYTSPFIMNERFGRLFESDHVDDKQGTGLVHIAPALGHDDFKLGIKHNLTTECFVNEQGRYIDNDPVLKRHNLAGLSVLDEQTTERIRQILNVNLLHDHIHLHAYPYDWRTKKPCIIRSSMQWFIDTARLKEKALEQIANVKVRPASLANTMSANLASRTYWCISRQRVWGVPIPCFYDSTNDPEHKQPLINRQFIDLLKAKIEKERGVDFWWKSSNSDLTNVLKTENSPQTSSLERSRDIFDIWFDSGCSFKAVQAETQADLYCEGVDQFSGWFQSSLLLSIASNNTSPFKSLLVHGFVVDETNSKMSKSIGNVIEPAQVIQGHGKSKMPQAGLDTVRFWVAHEHHKSKIQLGPQIMDKFLKRSFEIRSVVRFMVANLGDFKPLDGHLVEYDSLGPIDKYMLSKLTHLNETVLASYEDMQPNKAINLLEAYLLTQLSSLYFKFAKDRLYCETSDSPSRRKAQSTLYFMLRSILPLLAPVMPHLAEEAWHYSALNHGNTTLFRSNLDLALKWKNLTIEKQFEESMLKLRDEFNLNIKSTNSQIYHVEIEWSSEAGSSFSKEDIVECLQCASLEVKNVPTAIIPGITSVRVTNKFVCPRCRRQLSEKDSALCQRCETVMRLHG